MKQQKHSFGSRSLFVTTLVFNIIFLENECFLKPTPAISSDILFNQAQNLPLYPFSPLQITICPTAIGFNVSHETTAHLKLLKQNSGLLFSIWVLGYGINHINLQEFIYVYELWFFFFYLSMVLIMHF